jgi:hypothetical protein
MTGSFVAACHVHSDWSYDGKWSLPALATEFGSRGYQIVMLTEHDRGFTTARWNDYQAACRKASSATVMLLPGIEYSDPGNLVHILVWGCARFLGEGLPTTTTLSAAREANGISVLAHPSRRDAWKAFDRSWSEQLCGIEIWNRKTDGWAPSQSAPSLLTGTNLRTFAGLDFHGRRQFFPLSMRLRLKAEVSEDSILDSLRKSRFEACAFGRALDAMRPSETAALRILERVRRPSAGIARSIFGYAAPQHSRLAA